MNKKIYPATIVTKNYNITYSILRTSEARQVLHALITSLGYYPLNFVVSNGLTDFGFKELQGKLFDYRSGRRLASKVRPIPRAGFTTPRRDEVYYFDDSQYLIVYPELDRGFYFDYASFGYRWSYNISNINYFKRLHQDYNLADIYISANSGPKETQLGIENRRRPPRYFSRQKIPQHLVFVEFSGSILNDIRHWDKNLMDGMDSIIQLPSSFSRWKEFQLGPVYNLNKSGKIISLGFPMTFTLDEINRLTGFEIRPGELE